MILEFGSEVLSVLKESCWWKQWKLIRDIWKEWTHLTLAVGETRISENSFCNTIISFLLSFVKAFNHQTTVDIFMGNFQQFFGVSSTYFDSFLNQSLAKLQSSQEGSI
jgi:hypothetical protein